MSPTHPGVMYVALQDEFLKSTDFGVTWTRLGRAPKNLVAFTVHPRRADELYAILSDGALLKTTDGGTTWEQLRFRDRQEEHFRSAVHADERVARRPGVLNSLP